MDWLTRDMTAELSTSPALWPVRRCSALKALMVGRPFRASPMDVYTGEREMESILLTSLTLACTCRHQSLCADAWHT